MAVGDIALKVKVTVFEKLNRYKVAAQVLDSKNHEKISKNVQNVASEEAQ